MACLTDNDAHLALDPRDPFAIQTKPHGHGDVHALLHSKGLAKKWKKSGFKWVCFFQASAAGAEARCHAGGVRLRPQQPPTMAACQRSRIAASCALNSPSNHHLHPSSPYPPRTPQDTNALVFRALPVALGVSAASDYDMNSMAVPRKVGAGQTSHG